MPWTAKDATAKTKKASSPKKKRMWEHIANNLLAHGKSDKQAIIEANGVLKKRG